MSISFTIGDIYSQFLTASGVTAVDKRTILVELPLLEIAILDQGS